MRTNWAGIVVGAGVVVLAFVGAPMSVDALMWAGVDRPEVIGFQAAVAVGGALGMAGALVAARWWRWVVAAGVVGVGVVLAVSGPPGGGLSLRVRTAGESTVELPVDPFWGVVLAAASGALLIGVVSGARRVGAAWVVGVAAGAGYFGVSLTGALQSHPARVGIVGVAALVVVVAAVLSAERSSESRQVHWIAAGIVLLTAVPTLVVAVLGKPVLGSLIGALIGVALVGAALAAAGREWWAVGGLGLVLAAPFTSLVLLHSVVAGEIWYGWPIAAAGVVAGSLAGRAAPWVVGLCVIPALLLGLGWMDSPLVVWVFLALVMAAVAGCAATAVRTESVGALGVTAAVGFGHVLAALHGAGSVEGIVGRGGQVAAAVAFVVAAALLHLGTRGKGASGFVGGV
ncbi:hypothetical protein [Actinokineospora sp. UTMC 2448]|uniref:hypothetical protein n=1 Tax=Actinokineospora sp. UTMC 2448 TaxID=2268449 RepID=UPI0021644DCE|nr:hypothetical protein [Actinokineospora sp. UTMC 2448]UVS77514.1 hypothetical protein Actkin_01225 [Actinokineospora sp. UTMC 2448]